MKSELTERTRELAHRLTGSVEVLLLWKPESGAVELRMHDLVTAEGFEIRVPSANAMDAFRHPYAYAAREGAMFALNPRRCHHA
jgi:hypothetical protein